DRAKGGESLMVAGYEVLDELGRGGMGVVYKARHLGLNRTVALKMVLSAAHASAQELARFRLEAEAVARLQHTNIVQVFEVGEEDGRPFLSLEFVEGGSLDRRLRRHPQPPQAAARLVGQIARAVRSDHERGRVHRDPKPVNILLATPGADPAVISTAARVADDLYGVPKVSDFGLAKKLDGDSGQTQSGEVLGTPSYMAPEQ